MNHHPLSMSNWPKWEACPCALPSADDARGTEEARSGTHSHSWLAYLIRKGNGEDVAAPEGVTADERARAEWAYEKVQAFAGSYRPQSEVAITIHGASDWLDGIYGTADVLIEKPDRVVVIDYKTYSTNPCDLMAQPLGYGVAHISNDPFAPQLIEAVILHGGSREVQTEECKFLDAVARAERLMKAHAEKVDDTDCAAPNHFCQYCGRLKTCPATDRTLATVNEPVRFERLTLAEQMVVVKQAKSICDRVEKTVKAELDGQIDAGTPVEQAVVSGGGVEWRYELKPGNEKLSDICGLANEVGRHGVTQEELMRLCSVSKTAMCDALTRADGALSVAAAKRIIKPFYERGNPKKQLVRVA